jgi:hypothetical protein
LQGKLQKIRADPASRLAPGMHSCDAVTMSAAVERAVERTAVRFVRTWGFTTVGMVSQRFRLTTTTSEARREIAARALTRLPDLRWLDSDGEWFTLISRESPQKAALAKILATTSDVAREDLELALGKSHSFAHAPSGVVRAYIAELVANHGRSPSTARAARASALTGVERVLVDVLHERGGQAEIELLRHETAHLAITGRALRRAIALSPLLLPVARGTYRLVGAPVAARTLVSSGQWATAI